MSNLGKDWKDELTEDELQSLQYEVSLNGVKEEIRHVLNSEIARLGGLTPQQMYEVVKKYETYVARNKRLDGKGTSSSTSQQKATGHTSGYQPRFHKTTAFAATIGEAENDVHHSQESSPLEEVNSQGAESSQEDDEGLYIPSYLEEAIPDNPVLQVKMARESVKGSNPFQSAKWLKLKILKVHQVHFLGSPFCTCQMCIYMNLMSSYMSEW